MKTLNTFYNNSKILTVNDTDENSDEPDPSYSGFLNFINFKFPAFLLNTILFIKIFRRVKD